MGPDGVSDLSEFPGSDCADNLQIFTKGRIICLPANMQPCLYPDIHRQGARPNEANFPGGNFYNEKLDSVFMPFRIPLHQYVWQHTRRRIEHDQFDRDHSLRLDGCSHARKSPFPRSVGLLSEEENWPARRICPPPFISRGYGYAQDRQSRFRLDLRFSVCA